MTNPRDIKRTPTACRQRTGFPPRATDRVKEKKRCGVARDYAIGDILALSQNMRRILRSGQPAATALLGLTDGESKAERLEKLAALLSDSRALELRQLVLCRVPELTPDLKEFGLVVTPDDTICRVSYAEQTSVSYSTEDGLHEDSRSKTNDDGCARWVDMNVGQDD